MMREVWPPRDSDEENVKYSVACDGCETELPPRSSDTLAILDATAAGWLVRQRVRKFSGYATYDYCPNCRKGNG